jgi:methyl-accepting chemotaxis protein
MKRNLLYGLRGTILKYMALTSIIPVVVSILVLYVIARMALLSMAEQTMMNATHGIAKMCEGREEDAGLAREDAGEGAPRSALRDMIRETRIADSGYVYIVNSKGRIVNHPFWSGTVLAEKKDRGSGARLMDLINGNHGSFISYSIDGRDGSHSTKLAFVNYYRPLDWNIVATAEYNDILKSLNRIFVIMIAILVVSPVLILLVSGVLALRISRPFRSIVDTAVKVTEGDLGVFIPQRHYVKCAKIMNCTKEDCPAFGSRNLACWSIPGTVLDADGNPLPEKEKIEKVCSGCKIYRRAIQSEIDEIIEAVNKMIVTMQRIMGGIKRTAEELHADAEMLTRTSGLLREESRAQAASIEETMSSDEELVATIEHVSAASNVQADKMSQTSAAMEELTASTRSVGQHSIDLSTEAGRLVVEARQTEEMLLRTTDKIGRIEESSRKIGDIIAMINDVSDQINLLSLNASIESARAGEHGKGFAVVAEEISKLADATAQSTKEIETLIRTSRAEIGSGAELVNQTAGAITVIIQKIEAAAKLIGEIATSSEEQIRSSEQVMADVEEVNRMSLQIAQANQEQKQSSAEILQAVTLINDSLQKVAASSQDISESAEAMKERADRLHGIVGQFRVRE